MLIPFVYTIVNTLLLFLQHLATTRPKQTYFLFHEKSQQYNVESSLPICRSCGIFKSWKFPCYEQCDGLSNKSWFANARIAQIIAVQKGIEIITFSIRRNKFGKSYNFNNKRHILYWEQYMDTERCLCNINTILYDILSVV